MIHHKRKRVANALNLAEFLKLQEDHEEAIQLNKE